MGFLSSKFPAPLLYDPFPTVTNKELLGRLLPKPSASDLLNPEKFAASSVVFFSFVLQMLVTRTCFRPHVLSHKLGRPRLAPKPVVKIFAAAMSSTDAAMLPQPLMSGKRTACTVHRRLLQKLSGSLAAVPLTVRGVVKERRRLTDSQHGAVCQDG